MNAEYVDMKPFHRHFLSPEETAYLEKLKRMSFRNMNLFRLSKTNRNLIIDYLLEYYRLHVFDFPPLKSLDVLRELF
jgi:DNA repair protein RecO (recombination protein O)